MKELNTIQTQLVSGGERERIMFSVIAGALAGANHAAKNPNLSSTAFGQEVLLGIAAVTVGTQILSYLFESGSIDRETYWDRRIIAVI